MSEWISVENEIPLQKPEGWATYNWVLVTSKRNGTNEPWPFAIGRYTNEGWDLWLDNVPYCPCFGDTTDIFDKSEVTHWMIIPKPY
jgi:hypothetical protein